MNIPFRKDDYGKNFYIIKDGKKEILPYKLGKNIEQDIIFDVVEKMEDAVLKIEINISSNASKKVDCLGFHLGIDTYMEKYPEWNDKFFPTALRCEKNGFWSCFVSPNGKMISVCSPSKIISWKNEYNKCYGDVGHRIYTSSVEFINNKKQPKRHPKNIYSEIPKTPIHIELYYSFVKNKKELNDFINKYANINIPKINKFTLEKNDKLVIDNEVYNKKLRNGLNVIDLPKTAEVTVFVRNNWFYYLDCARKSAESCQQKPGTHCESWYGYFTMVEYAKIINDKKYTYELCNKFDSFFKTLTKGNKTKKMRFKALPNRLQNVSSMISLLTDFFELTNDIKYLNYANDMASWLISLQSEKDGSYRNNGVHYTCVIYPAKSILELATAEKNVGLVNRSNKHFESARKAVKNLFELMDNIDTEGEMTFEDGMISCEVLQLAYFALLTDNVEEKIKFTEAAEILLKKHLCLEQQFLPDCRVRGCTLRFWEARYDLNFLSNMLNSPHGWTSWKNYATYYLYLLTGKIEYLSDLMDTIGACMQCVHSNGVLRWGYVADPCIVGQNLSKGCTKKNVYFEENVVGEEYLPMISDWYRQSDKKLKYQYIRIPKSMYFRKKDFGGSCDNDVHEHFKCLCETVFGKVFIHEKEYGIYETYNCYLENEEFKSDDCFVKEIVCYSLNNYKIRFNHKDYNVKKGLNILVVN